VFLVKKVCHIYPDRPKCCVDYQCAWSQHLLPEHLRPDQSGVLVSVEQRDGVQFFKVVELVPDVKWEVLYQIDQAARKLNTFWELIKHHA
jgi:Fe-S-cluster containining protein